MLTTDPLCTLMPGTAHVPGSSASDSLLGVLNVKKLAHDKFKLSIYPQPIRKWTRKRWQAYRLRSIQKIWKRDYGCDLGRSEAYGKALAAVKAEAACSLDSSKKFQDDNGVVSGYGGLPRRKRFSRYAADRIGEIGWYGWKKFGGSGWVGTVTLPGNTGEVIEAWARYSGQYVAWLRQWIRDVTSAEHSVILVWEPHSHGKLHLHVAVLTADAGSIQRLQMGWFTRCYGWIDRICDLAGLDMYRTSIHTTYKNCPELWQWDSQILRKNPARYFAKYVTKEARSEARKATFHPSRWWSVDRKTTQAVSKLRTNFVLSGGVITDLKEQMVMVSLAVQKFASLAVAYVNPKFSSCGGEVLFVPEDKWTDSMLAISQISAHWRARFVPFSNPQN